MTTEVPFARVMLMGEGYLVGSYPQVYPQETYPQVYPQGVEILVGLTDTVEV